MNDFLKCARKGCNRAHAEDSVFCSVHSNAGTGETCDNLPAVTCKACGGTGKVFDELVLEIAACPFGCVAEGRTAR
jgi:hypothetical protein